jgi:hypothetical protein
MLVALAKPDAGTNSSARAAKLYLVRAKPDAGSTN